MAQRGKRMMHRFLRHTDVPFVIGIIDLELIVNRPLEFDACGVGCHLCPRVYAPNEKKSTSKMDLSPWVFENGS